MTADKMFRELGYRKPEGYYAGPQRIWEKFYSGGIMKIKIDKYDAYKTYMGKEWNTWENGEILACAQLIKEMEEKE